MNITKVWKYMLLACLLMLVAPAQAQRFFNLTSHQDTCNTVVHVIDHGIRLN